MRIANVKAQQANKWFCLGYYSKSSKLSRNQLKGEVDWSGGVLEPRLREIVGGQLVAQLSAPWMVALGNQIYT